MLEKGEMMSVFLCGDIHGTLDIGKIVSFFSNYDDELTKQDYLIICGDVAVCGFSHGDEVRTRETLRNLPVTVLFCDGNHENFDELNSYVEEEWHGGLVHMIENDIIHLMRGQVYEIDSKKFFVFGGAYSVDRSSRVEGVTWFKEEVPTEEEYHEGWKNLEKENYKVDYVVSHTAPYEICSEMGFGSFDEAAEQTREFQRFADCLEFEEWYFGHFHVDDDVEQFHCLWDNIVEL